MSRNYEIKAKVSIGDTYNYLTVVDNPIKKDGSYYVKVRCVCGNEKYVDKYNLIRKNTTLKSCGCLKRGDKEKSSINKSIYGRWSAMKQRCLNPEFKQYKDYGGRGISICEEWVDFANFKEWALQNGYSREKVLDRIDTNQNYSPNNCRWVSTFVSSINKRNTILIDAFDERKSLSEWFLDSRCKVGIKTLQTRFYLKKYALWTSEEKISKPAIVGVGQIHKNSILVKAFNETKSIYEWSNDPRCRVDYSTLKGRIQRNKSKNLWTNEQLIETANLRSTLAESNNSKYGV